MKNSYPGKFIVFEGLDGSGQSTQAELLREFLKEKGYQVLVTKEPTNDSEPGKKIRKILEGEEKCLPLDFQRLYVQDRKWHLENVIIPALEQGKIVISDRYFFSTFAFGASEGLDIIELYQLNEEFLLPDIVFFLDVNPKLCMTRIEKRGIEKQFFEKEEKLTKVYGNYKKTFKDFEGKTKIYFINGEKSINEVFEEIKNYVKEYC